ncbi:MAG: ABC transporter substrate-binding protein [Pseudoclavibacter sp.]
MNPDSGITDEAQLEGKTVAVLARSSTHELGISAAVDRAGGDPSSINWVSLDFASAIEALKSGSVDAAGLVSPFTNAALDDGLVQLGAPTAQLFGSGAVTTLWVSTPATIAKKGDAINAFIAAQEDAATYANEHLEEALGVAKEITGVGLDIDQMTLTYWVPTLDPEELDSQMELMVEYGLLQEPLDMTDIAYIPPAS